MKATWAVLETEHYIFHYQEGSLAAKEISQIAAEQEDCHRQITEKLAFTPRSKITYWLCATRKDLMEQGEFDFETNGVTITDPDDPQIYAVYNDECKCTGFHEDVHAIMCQYANPSSSAVVEGLAMYFDRVWWGIPNDRCTRVYLEDGKYEKVEKMITDNDFFYYQVSDIISYPIVGAFTAFLVEAYGIEKYKKLYHESDDMAATFAQIYGKNLTEAEDEFVKEIMGRTYSAEEMAQARKELYS